jgi:hypothetical protein
MLIAPFADNTRIAGNTLAGSNLLMTPLLMTPASERAVAGRSGCGPQADRTASPPTG